MFINWKRKKKKRGKGYKRSNRGIWKRTKKERSPREREKESVGENLPNLEKPLNRS